MSLDALRAVARCNKLPGIMNFADNPLIRRPLAPRPCSLIQDRNFAQFWVQGASLFEGMDEVERYRFKSLLIWWLIFHENIFYQHEKRLIDEPTYSSWNEDLKNFVSRMNLAEHWPGLRSSFQKGFAEHVGKLVDSSRRVEH